MQNERKTKHWRIAYLGNQSPKQKLKNNNKKKKWYKPERNPIISRSSFECKIFYILPKKIVLKLT